MTPPPPTARPPTWSCPPATSAASPPPPAPLSATNGTTPTARPAASWTPGGGLDDTAYLAAVRDLLAATSAPRTPASSRLAALALHSHALRGRGTPLTLSDFNVPDAHTRALFTVDASLGITPRTRLLTWTAQAPHARDRGLGAMLFARLAAVRWTRGTGGVLRVTGAAPVTWGQPR